MIHPAGSYNQHCPSVCCLCVDTKNFFTNRVISYALHRRRAGLQEVFARTTVNREVNNCIATIGKTSMHVGRISESLWPASLNGHSAGMNVDQYCVSLLPLAAQLHNTPFQLKVITSIQISQVFSTRLSLTTPMLCAFRNARHRDCAPPAPKCISAQQSSHQTTSPSRQRSNGKPQARD